MFAWLVHGVGFPDLAILFARVLLGLFYVLARFRWIYDPSRPDQPWLNRGRHEHLIGKMAECHYPPNRYLAGALALTEISAGLGVLFGAATVLAAIGLVVVTTFATLCTAKAKVLEQHPVDWIDDISDYLWRVEIWVLIVAITIILHGPGAYSIDALLMPVLGM
jgi:uncharacterized membrane protein YphA (DoxX/SURF4 family)